MVGSSKFFFEWWIKGEIEKEKNIIGTNLLYLSSKSSISGCNTYLMKKRFQVSISLTTAFLQFLAHSETYRFAGVGHSRTTIGHERRIAIIALD
uniref:Uncharacterized protein n=1 Tax=Romanomermis culicivorax TaxID=13658 RepID=A0A915IMX5_ROMCU